MGTHYSPRLIVGVSAKELYSAEVRQEIKTKYDENTGRPYTVKVNRLYAKFGNTDLPPVEGLTSQYVYREEFSQNWEFLEKTGLDIHFPFCDCKTIEKVQQFGIVGVSLGSQDKQSSWDNNYVVSSESIISSTIEKVKKALSVFGYTDEVKVFAQVQGG